MDQTTTDMQLYRARLGVRVGPRAPVFLAYQALEHSIQELENVLRRVPSTLTFDQLRAPDQLAETSRTAAGREVTRTSAAVHERMEQFPAAAAAVTSSGA